MAPGGFGKAQVHRHRTEQHRQAQRAAEDVFALSRKRYLAVAAKPNGQRTIMLVSSNLSEVEAFVAKHRPFAIAAGGNLTVEVDEMVVVEVRR
jgi:hypothetical protein